MNWGVGLAEQIIGVGKKLGSLVVGEFESMHMAWRTWAEIQHNDDGTHSAITADSVTTASLQPTAGGSSKIGDYVPDGLNPDNDVATPFTDVYAANVHALTMLEIGSIPIERARLTVDINGNLQLNCFASFHTSIVPQRDGDQDLGYSTAPGVGSSNKRWRHLAISGELFFGSANTRLQSGTGSPESVKIGNVGDLYTDVTGGAGTTLYVKESGTGSIGWIGK